MTNTTEGYTTADYAAKKRPLESGTDSATAPKRSFQGGSDPLLKLTVPVYMAGALIGKGGTLLNELKEQYGGNIRISAGKEYYPGTEERVVVLTGTLEQIVSMNQYIMEKMEDPGRDSSMKNINIDERRSKRVKIILTGLAAGLLIGKGGTTIKGIQSSCKATISISSPDESVVPGERVLTVIGEINDRAAAIQQIVEVIAKEPSNMQNYILRYPETSTFKPAVFNKGPEQLDREQIERAVMAKLGMAPPMESPNNNGAGPGNNSVFRLQGQVEVNVDIPSGLVGGILGKSGAIVKEISQRSGGAHLKFGDKPVDANAARNLKITGNMDQTYKAYNLVEERVIELENQQRAKH